MQLYYKYVSYSFFLRVRLVARFTVGLSDHSLVTSLFVFFAFRFSFTFHLYRLPFFLSLAQDSIFFPSVPPPRAAVS